MLFLSDFSHAEFARPRGSKDKQPRKKGMLGSVGGAVDRGISGVAKAGTSPSVGLIGTGLGFGAGYGLLRRPNSGSYQRKAAIAGTAIGAGLAGYQAIRNRMMQRKKKRF